MFFGCVGLLDPTAGYLDTIGHIDELLVSVGHHVTHFHPAVGGPHVVDIDHQKCDQLTFAHGAQSSSHTHSPQYSRPSAIG